LLQHSEQFERLRALARQGPVTLIFSARDEVHNDAVVLRDVLMAIAGILVATVWIRCR
jgi:uncharacterized protein YeaO (DUF488 family)